MFFRDKRRDKSDKSRLKVFQPSASFASVALSKGGLGVNLRRGPPEFSKANDRSRWETKDENVNTIPPPSDPPATVRKVTEKINQKSPPAKPVLRRVIDEDAVFYRTDPLLYHKFGSMVIFRPRNLY